MDEKQREHLKVSDDTYVESDGSEEYLHMESLSEYEENKENKVRVIPILIRYILKVLIWGDL